MKDCFSPIQLLINRVPRRQFEMAYSILLPNFVDHEINNLPPTPHELLTTVAFMKGFMSSKGIPDCSRSARLILDDFINGRLKWIASPPDFSQDQFDNWTYPATSCDRNHDQYGLNLLKQVNFFNFIFNTKIQFLVRQTKFAY